MESSEATVLLRKLSEMLTGDAWKLLDAHYALQEQHQLNQALDLKGTQETRMLALGAYHAIKAMRIYPTQLANSLKSHVAGDLHSS